MVRELVREYRPLERASVVIAEVEEASGHVQGKGYFRKLRGWKWGDVVQPPPKEMYRDETGVP